ncbi:growth hormone secretagogue receptor type 1-like [Erpetoichthys calabaricus]|nr:growth hormone secretagogue receptor type 1-like [Erpetoichthys calabaricus]
MSNSTLAAFDSRCSEDCHLPANFTVYPLPDQLFSLPILVVVTVVCILLFLVGLTGNILTILIVLLNKDMRSTTNLYLSSMALSDLFIFLLMPIDLYKLWKYRPWNFGDFICKLFQFMSECCTYSSILHITALSMERYFAVCFPLQAKVTITRSRIRVVIALLWTLALLSAGPVFALVGVEFDNGMDGECRCTHYAISSGLLTAMMWVSSIYFFVPVCCLSVLYGLIGRKLWRRRHITLRDRTNRKTVKMLVVIVLAFVICWLPFHIGRMLFSVSAATSEMYRISQYFNLVSFVLFYLSAAINPILYNLMSGRYRAAVCKLFRRQQGVRLNVRHTSSHLEVETNV